MKVSLLLKDILGNTKTRIMVLFYVSIIAITGFFIIYGYFAQLKSYEESELKRLKGIVSSLAIQTDGDTHLKIIEKYLWMDGIKSIEDDSLYKSMFVPLSKAQETNKLSSPIYTMFYDDEEKVFLYIINSDSTPTFRHKYEMYPDSLLAKMNKGGVLTRYETESGEWLSAFHPFFDSEGNLAGLIQADIEFGQFRTLARERYMQQSLISLGVMLLLALILIPYVRSILKEDEAVKIELFQQKELIEERNKNLNESIDYARKIQESILQESSQLSELVPNSFIYYQPKEIVSGDFYWYKKCENDIIYIAVADCTGYAVPGALMSIKGMTDLDSIINEDFSGAPSEIINKMDSSVISSLSNKTYTSESQDGMNIGICKIDTKQQKLNFSGALFNLVKINNSDVSEIKGSKRPIGGGASYKDLTFENTELEINPGDHFFLCTDGFSNQFGGKSNKKYMNKNFKKLLATIVQLDDDKKITTLDKEFNDWKGAAEQIDDVLVVGIRF